MSIAPNKRALKRRIDRYLWDNETEEMKLLRNTLECHFKEFTRVAVIGGLVRDIAREGRKSFRTDVDLVIDGPVKSVSKLAKNIGAVPNRFGGYGFKDGLWKIDFWALETTWARRHVSVQKIEDLMASTFFDWDAVAYDLWNKKIICSNGYFDKIKNSILDVNLYPNPSPLGNLVRAIRRIAIWQAKPGPELVRFIDENLNEDSLIFVQAKEKELYQVQISTRWNNVKEAKKYLFEIKPEEKIQLDLYK